MPRQVHLATALRSAPRAAEVATALTRFGFGTLLREIGLDRFVDKSEEEKAHIGQRPIELRVRLLLEELGSTFIKLGQIASTRADLLPASWIWELKKLQGKVPPSPWEGEDGIGAFLESEYGERLATNFHNIEHEALAGASIAQTHRATLSTGEKVVLKILRPGIRERLTADIELMRLLSYLVQSYLETMGFDPEAVIDEFSRQLLRETDFRIEARSMARMGDDFRDVDGVAFPHVYKDLSTESVLVMEEITGTLLSDLDVSLLDDQTREAIVRNGADAVFRQCLQIGFFHADPHPGNIFVLEEGSLCFVDCGMTGLIEPRTLDQFAQITHGAITGDLDRVVRSAIQLADADPALVDNRALRAAVWRFIDEFRQGTLESLDMGRLLNEFFTVLREYHLHCPPDVVYLIKALTTIESVASSIAPDFDVVSHVHPYVERLVRDRHGVHAIKERSEKALLRYIDLVEDLPDEISRVLRSLGRNRLSLQLNHKGLDTFTEEVERASMNISWSLGIAAVIVGSSVLVLADSVDQDVSILTAVAVFGFVSAVAVGLFRLVRLWLGRRD
ncbi:MAG: AarF/ABC1/UbiB kinase family protein [Planctomycetes bacterium]|nr:AarF/ABC1/UbiB kinase family protein [Planctomycetota bacterium]NOG55040.1 AarF/ABC1/UbiB kinase family protein [Planctomycetota bacterium]